MMSLLPALVGGGAAAGGAVAAGTGLAQLSTLATAGAGLASGIAAYQGAKGEEQRAKINAEIGRTRAIQTDTVARQGLNSELAQLSAALAANGQRLNVGSGELMKELRDVRARERRIGVGNEMQGAADWRQQSRNARAAALGAGFQGITAAAPSMFDYMQLRAKR